MGNTLLYETTSNLDTSETNLKLRKALDITCKMQDIESLCTLRGVIQSETPNEKLYQFNGRLVIFNSESKEELYYSLNHLQLLHRVSIRF
jgi:phospholipid-transporting ATPase